MQLSTGPTSGGTVPTGAQHLDFACPARAIARQRTGRSGRDHCQGGNIRVVVAVVLPAHSGETWLAGEWKGLAVS